MPGSTDQGWKQKPPDGRSPRGDVQATSPREGSRSAFASEKEPCVAVSVSSFSLALLTYGVN